MKSFKLDNGVRVIYKKIQGEMTSFCIGFEAGANSENGYNYGVAHALEHMLFKGTKSKSEREINITLDRIFAFNNAMTNYPYAIYYGSCSSYDFKEGFELFKDILINPRLKKDGFEEEIKVILQESEEWKEDYTQYCEDNLFLNSYKEKRIRETIIGNKETIKRITLEELKKFYEEYYIAENCVITIISSLRVEEIISIVNQFNIKKGKYKNILVSKEINRSGTYNKEIQGFQGGKIQYIFNINNLTFKEIEALSLYSLYLGEGMSSLLFEEVRNNWGYAYDIGSSIKKEKGIEVFSITTSTSKNNISRVISLINDVIEKSREIVENLTFNEVEELKKRLVLKREFTLERSVELAKYITTNEIMFNNGQGALKFKENLANINKDEIVKVINKALVNPSIEMLY